MLQLESKHPLVVLGDAAEMDFREVAAFNNGTIGIFRSGAGQSPWEYHPDDDEILYAMDGAVTITVLSETDSIDVLVEKGALLVVPRGHWHRHTVHESLVELYVTPGATRHSMADDPRIEQ
ncbi:MAG: cupin domain-containing protein [Gammaproteobacteria bacterium]|nr:cupin domain-containing protein [Gammaproteobacteria bacterium]MDH3767751.1 cupin domain-containing protein [Gammaproteobacteria bacterium]